MFLSRVLTSSAGTPLLPMQSGLRPSGRRFYPIVLTCNVTRPVLTASLMMRSSTVDIGKDEDSAL